MFFIISIVVLPLISPDAAKYLNTLEIDVDPQKTLPADEPNRLYNAIQKEKFLLHDLVVVGITNDTHANGVFNVKSLQNIRGNSLYPKNIPYQRNTYS